MTPSSSQMLAVDVIVRTLAERSRASGLTRALDGIANQAGVDARAIVIVNGDRFDQGVVDDLQQRSDITLDFVDEGSLIAARRRGLELVKAPVFTFLDDDDELYPDSLAAPLGWLRAHPDDDAVITLTDMSSRGATTVLQHNDCQDAPLRTLLESCWLHPGSGFFRADEAVKTIIDVPRSHMEWTTIAFRLVTQGTSIHFMNVATVIYHDTHESMSKNVAHQQAEVELMRQIMRADSVDRDIRRRARDKYLNTLHTLAAAYHRLGQRSDAWRAHIKSLTSGGFFKYALYTRKLLR